MKSKLFRYIIAVLGLLLLLIAIWKLFFNMNERDLFAKSFKEAGINGKLIITYPKNNTLFPPEIASSTFEWDDPDNEIDQWLVMVEADNKIQFVSKFLNEKNWKPDSTEWERIKIIARDKGATVNIIGVKQSVPGKIFNSGNIQIKISKDSVGAPIFFRAVPLPFSFAVKNLPTISWRLANVSNYTQPKILLTNFPVCGNCHSFSKDGKTIGMDVDYANDKGSYYISSLSGKTEITYDKIMTWSDYKRDDKELTFGLLSQVSPDGKNVISTVKDRSIFVAVDNLDYSQLFFPIKGILAVYNTANKKINSLPGADNRELCQSNPIWSPDGNTILFTRTTAYRNSKAEQSTEVILPTEYASEFLEGKKDFKFDIYKIPFNNGNGGVAVPLNGASGNGMSNFFPKYSPDGKWIVFTQAKNFMLLQPDAKLYIMPSGGGEPRLMNCNNLGTMNSWHSWSPNGKWLVFSSKAKGPYTQLFLTHIDENGNDSPAILLENMGVKNRAANIPEFVNTKFNEIDNLVEKFIDNDNYSMARGKEKIRQGDYPGALKELDKAISLNPNDDVSYNQRGIINMELGNHQQALSDFAKVIALKPNSFFAYHNRANLKIQMKDYIGAIADMDIAIKMNPQGSTEYYSRGEARYEMKDYNNAIKDFNIAIQLNPKFDKAYSMRASSKYLIEDYKGSLDDFNKSIEYNPKDAAALFKRAFSKIQLGMKESAFTDLQESLKLGNKNAAEIIKKLYGDRPQ
jgi:tetratricopeptide (TPR) repeat protein